MKLHPFSPGSAAALFLAVTLLPAMAYAQAAGYWHTSGSQILDSANKAVRISGVNWYGFETTDEVVHGLSAQDYKAILTSIQSNGYNVIRMPFSNQMVESPIVPSSINYGSGKNSDLSGLNSLQILDKIVTYAGSIGLHIILDDHRSSAGNSTESGLWYTSSYPESAWLNDWKTLTNRYLNNSTVIGVDLRNEPHDANNSGSCWGCGGTMNDWSLAAGRGGNAVLAINPHLLVFVEGTDCYTDCDWWGGNLEGAQAHPVVLSVANQLVYSAHDYGPNLYAQSWFNSSTTQSSLNAVWTKFWGYLSINGIAPVWLGEFGTTNNNSDIKNSAAGSQGQWFQDLVAYLKANSAINWTYWALNGEDSYALLDSNYDSTPANATKQQLLASIQFASTGGSTGGGGTTGGGTGGGSTTSCHVTYTDSNDWGSGFSGGITIANTGTTTISNWTLSWSWPGNQQMTQSWNANYSQTGAAVKLTYESYNAMIAAGSSVTGIGFNANYSGTNTAPTAFSVNGTLCH